MWLVHLSIIHSVAFGAVPYSVVRGIGFTKRNVKRKHLTNKHTIKVQILVRVDRVIFKKPWDKIHSETILALYLASHKMF